MVLDWRLEMNEMLDKTPNKSLITLDVDWAPDFMIEFAMQKLLEHQVKSTWFITHDSFMLGELRKQSDMIELGIHPNFLPGSSHGDSVEKALNYVMDLVPEAVSVRTHGVVQSGRILSDFVRLTPVRMDATIFLPEMSGIKKVKHLTPFGELQRIPTYWADDYAILRPDNDWRINGLLEQQGIKVFNFHPVHIYLNTKDNDHYESFRSSGIRLNTATAEQVAPYVNQGVGVRDFFLTILNNIRNGGSLLKAFIS